MLRRWLVRAVYAGPYQPRGRVAIPGGQRLSAGPAGRGLYLCVPVRLSFAHE
jgi:hypothetical protein